MPQPEGGPVDQTRVVGRANVAADDEDMLLAVAATNAYVRGLPVADLPEPADEEDLEWPDTVVLGATMLAVLLTKRKNSAESVYSLQGTEGTTFVRRSDPHIALLLQLGDEAKPAVG